VASEAPYSDLDFLAGVKGLHDSQVLFCCVLQEIKEVSSIKLEYVQVCV
jgi:hypothetical protein